MMYTVGSVFYGIYFWASFPMFFRMDEDPSEERWTLVQSAHDSFAAGMIVTVILDLWRLIATSFDPTVTSNTLPWL